MGNDLALFGPCSGHRFVGFGSVPSGVLSKILPNEAYNHLSMSILTATWLLSSNEL